MMLSHPLLDAPIMLREGKPFVLVIENPLALRNTVHFFKENDPQLVLSEDFNPIDLAKTAEFTDNIFDVDFASKKIITKLNAEAETLFAQYPNETANVFSTLNALGDFLASGLDVPAKFSFVHDADKIIKLLNFTIDTADMSLPEQLLIYMDICRKFLQKKLFVFLNLKFYLTEEELLLFYQNIAYENFRVLLLESHSGTQYPAWEESCIIDRDLCII